MSNDKFSLRLLSFLIISFNLSEQLNDFVVYYPVNNDLIFTSMLAYRLASFKYKNKYECFLKCNNYSNCTMLSTKSNQCNLYYKIDYDYMTMSTEKTTLFNKPFNLEYK